MKKIVLVLLAVSSLVSNFALAKTTGTGEKQNEEQLMEILEEDILELGLKDITVLKNQVIVLDIDGNILLKASLEAVENRSLSSNDLLLLSNSERVMDNLGDQIFVLNF